MAYGRPNWTRRDYTRDRRVAVLSVLPWWWILGHNLVGAAYMRAQDVGSWNDGYSDCLQGGQP